MMPTLTKRVALTVLVAIGVLLACSGSGTGGASATTWEAYCKGAAERDQKCGDPADEAGCVANKDCWESGWRTSALGDLASCLNARACGASDDPCHASAGAAVPKTAVMNDYFAKCSKWMDCGGSDDLCYSRAAVLSDATLQALAICFDKPCADQEPCAEPILSSVYCW